MMPLLRLVILVASGAVVPACSSWPGVSGKNDGSGGNAVSTPPNAQIGTCSGTPQPCSALDGADCFSTSGCQDLGSCSGTPTVPGEACGAEISYQGCMDIPGCFWAPRCMGTPLGTCSAVTKAQCLLAKGCIFTPAHADTGAGGSSSSTTCNSYASRCASNSGCDCGFSCVVQCPTCAAVCGTPCLTDLDCVVARGPNGATPFCTGVTNPPTSLYPGLCSDSLAGR